MDIEFWILYSWDESWQVLSLLLVFISASHPNLQYVADFAPELGLIIMETKYLEQLGFQVPELARNVALQVFCQITSLNSVWIWICMYMDVMFSVQSCKFCDDHKNIPIFSSLYKWPWQAVYESH